MSGRPATSSSSRKASSTPSRNRLIDNDVVDDSPFTKRSRRPPPAEPGPAEHDDVPPELLDRVWRTAGDEARARWVRRDTAPATFHKWHLWNSLSDEEQRGHRHMLHVWNTIKEQKEKNKKAELTDGVKKFAWNTHPGQNEKYEILTSSATRRGVAPHDQLWKRLGPEEQSYFHKNFRRHNEQQDAADGIRQDEAEKKKEASQKAAAAAYAQDLKAFAWDQIQDADRKSSIMNSDAINFEDIHPHDQLWDTLEPAQRRVMRKNYHTLTSEQEEEGPYYGEAADGT